VKKFELNKSIEVLERTPTVLESLLIGVSDDWIMNNEGGDSWSPHEVVGHLIHNELTDWMPRIKIIFSDRVDKTFEPFDRFAHLNKSQEKSIGELIAAFKDLRIQSLKQLKAFEITDVSLMKTGVHPALGEVNLRQLLSSWVVHDLGHIGQIVRVMAKQYKKEVGPWVEYLGVLK